MPTFRISTVMGMPVITLRYLYFRPVRLIPKDCLIGRKVGIEMSVFVQSKALPQWNGEAAIV